jgi:hypothetical protein
VFRIGPTERIIKKEVEKLLREAIQRMVESDRPKK